LRDLRFITAASGTGMNAQNTDIASANCGPPSAFATLHLPLEPQLLFELPHEPPPQPPPELELPQLPQLLLPLDELLLQLVQLSPELVPEPPLHPPPLHPPPPPDDVLSDEHESQPPPWWFEFEQPLSHDSELLQLGPEQSQLGEAVQFSFLFEHESLQLTFVERGGSVGSAVPPSTSPGNGVDGGP
jgi:hypothetical protein